MSCRDQRLRLLLLTPLPSPPWLQSPVFGALEGEGAVVMEVDADGRVVWQRRAFPSKAPASRAEVRRLAGVLDTLLREVYSGNNRSDAEGAAQGKQSGVQAQEGPQQSTQSLAIASVVRELVPLDPQHGGFGADLAKELNVWSVVLYELVRQVSRDSVCVLCSAASWVRRC